MLVIINTFIYDTATVMFDIEKKSSASINHTCALQVY